MIVTIVTKTTNKILSDYLYILIKNLLKKPKNWKKFQNYLFKKNFIIDLYMKIKNLNNWDYWKIINHDLFIRTITLLIWVFKYKPDENKYLIYYKSYIII
jgi:hypothetical protein